MDKREFEVSKLAIRAKNIEAFIGTFRLVVVSCTILGAIWLILSGLHPFIGQSPEVINAFAILIEKFHLGSIFGYVLAGICGIGWAAERRGKQRAIAEKAKFQKIAEEDEPNRSSSGLTPTGQTPITP